MRAFIAPARVAAGVTLCMLVVGCTETPAPLPPPSPPPEPTATVTVRSSPSPLPNTPTTEASPTPTPSSVTALPDPTGFRWTLVTGGLTKPVDFQPVEGGVFLIVEQAGLIRILEDGVLQTEPFLDIRDRVNDGSTEQGLLGLALHPNFQSNGLLYVNYTGSGGYTFIARYQANPDGRSASSDSEVVLLGVTQPFPNHNGGGMSFGPDGYLYIALGDGGFRGDPFGNGQRLDTLLGKLLRIDVDGVAPYGMPPDNPFISGSFRSEIWAYGLRNPWRFAFDPATGDLYISDVGQNAWEEVNYQPAGAPGGVNYGWNLREGFHRFAGEGEGLADPVAEYGHDLGCSVTGGVVVRDPALPEWAGVYLYGDACSGRVWGLVRDEAGTWQTQVLFETGFGRPSNGPIYGISSFGQGPNGEAYLVAHRGEIYRLDRSG
ncbi:MAG: PQQ-dependent sugar dehydrogenase [Anaerolineae bacterium]